jgi:primosomal replication protein N
VTRAVTIGLIALIGLAAPAAAQGPIDTAARDALRWSDHRQVADVASTVLVAVAVAYPCLQDRTWACAGHEAARVGLAVGLAEATKHFVHRTRPNGVDQKSFFSEHTAIACAAVLHTHAWALCPAVAYGRIASDWHWTSDTLTGAGVAAGVTALVTVVW